jgi:Fic family protein
MNLFKKSSPVFRPQYRVTDRILNSITRSTAAKELITQVHLPADWVANFRREAILRSAHASTSLDGNPLSFNDVCHLMMERQVESQDTARREVLNYVTALKNVDAILNERRISEAMLLRVHQALTKNVLDGLVESGVFRLQEITTDSAQPRGLMAAPPPLAKDVPALVKRMLAWLDSPEAENLNTIIQAGIVHHEIMRIRPFSAGSGLVARFMANVILYLRNFDTRRLFTLDGFYQTNPPAYFSALASHSTNSDLTPWLEYFSDGVAHSIAEVKERVISLTSELARGTRSVPVVPPIPE